VQVRLGPVASPLDGVAEALIHGQGPLRLPGQELPNERVIRVEHVLRRSRLDDPALPQNVDVVSHPAGGEDVVGNHAERGEVLALLLLGVLHRVAVDLKDQLTEQGRAHRVEP